MKEQDTTREALPPLASNDLLGSPVGLSAGAERKNNMTTRAAPAPVPLDPDQPWWRPAYGYSPQDRVLITSH